MDTVGFDVLNQEPSRQPGIVSRGRASGESEMSPASSRNAASRIAILDGWRAVSIVAVLAGHLLPLGPSQFQLNAAVAASGMAIFFTLSGFLIASILRNDPDVRRFLIHRICRIVPLAWLAMVILAFANHADLATVAANALFYANLPPARLMYGGEHLWSLCVEVQFYGVAALLVLIAGRRGLYALPVAALVITGMRIFAGETISIVTWHRVDEILAGATLALVLAAAGVPGRKIALPRWLPILLGGCLLASAHPALPWLGYCRPYFAAAMVGCSIVASPAWLRRALESAPARYVAEISYALYVVHAMLSATWLGSGNGSMLQKYALRPVLIAATWGLAHLSTFHFERRWIALGKRLADDREPVAANPGAPGTGAV